MSSLIRALFFRWSLAILFIVLAVTFLHFDFLSSGLWWTLFSLLGLSEFASRFTSYGQGKPSKIVETSINVALSIIVILSFVFFWWRGGVGMVVALFIWMGLWPPVIVLIKNWLDEKI